MQCTHRDIQFGLSSIASMDISLATYILADIIGKYLSLGAWDVQSPLILVTLQRGADHLRYAEGLDGGNGGKTGFWKSIGLSNEIHVLCLFGKRHV